MVEDGNRLFVDKNANGDLTDDGPPIEARHVRHKGASSSDFEYLLEAITLTNGAQHTNFVLRRWNNNEKEGQLRIISFRGAVKRPCMRAGSARSGLRTGTRPRSFTLVTFHTEAPTEE
jgi:hypothetical protein